MRVGRDIMHVWRRTLLLVLALRADAMHAASAQHAQCPSEWVDVDTPSMACTSRRERDGEVLKLVFSDEFERGGRGFRDGEDARWTALESYVPPRFVSTTHVLSRRNCSTAVSVICSSHEITSCSQVASRCVQPCLVLAELLTPTFR